MSKYKVGEVENIWEAQHYGAFWAGYNSIHKDGFKAAWDRYRQTIEGRSSCETEYTRPPKAVPDDYVNAAEEYITEICCNAVDKLNELAPDQGWDPGERTAEIYIRKLRALLAAAPKP